MLVTIKINLVNKLTCYYLSIEEGNPTFKFRPALERIY